jgi:hypothetical protein
MVPLMVALPHTMKMTGFEPIRLSVAPPATVRVLIVSTVVEIPPWVIVPTAGCGPHHEGNVLVVLLKVAVQVMFTSPPMLPAAVTAAAGVTLLDAYGNVTQVPPEQTAFAPHEVPLATGVELHAPAPSHASAVHALLSLQLACGPAPTAG